MKPSTNHRILSRLLFVIAFIICSISAEAKIVHKYECLGGNDIYDAPTYYANKIGYLKEGKTIEEVSDWLLNNRLKLCHWIAVDDLFFLKRGGRISATTAVVGSALKIKPILRVDEEGCLHNLEKARGRKKSLDILLKHFEETAIEPGTYPVYISHGDCVEDAEYLAEKLKEVYGVKEILTHILDPVIGAHAGPGTVGLFFYGEHR